MSWGFGLPAAVGAKPQHRTTCCMRGRRRVGQMNSQELMTAVSAALDIKIVILNNRFLGMVRQWQEFFYDKNYADTNLEDAHPDFVKLAEAYGAKGFRCDNPEHVTRPLNRV